jgi:lysyl-tRNA synthetase class 1
MTEKGAHWADQAVDKLLERGRRHHISTGISPSGEIHVGHLREVVTADALHRVLKEKKADVRFHYLADNMDPLRKVYPFLDAAVYEQHVGKPLYAIPCPCGGHESYSDHFLAPFIEGLKALRIDAEILKSHELYASGRFNGVILAALEGRDRIREILHEATGKQMADTWSPFNALCAACGKIAGTTTTGFSAADETVSYTCACGHDGTNPLAGGGKLTWRVDWPARWSALGVTCEPFGKDHATRGGSYDTGGRIIREVFGGEPPYPVVYEWISLRGRGDMSSSKGNVLSIGDMLEVVPPEILRYLIVKSRPGKTITFDPGLPLAQMIDEYDRLVGEERPDRNLQLSRAAGFVPSGVPFRHIVTICQIAGGDTETALAVLKRSGYDVENTGAIASRLAYAGAWLARFAPEDMKFSLQPELPAGARDLTAGQKKGLGLLAEGLQPGATGEDIHQAIYDTAEAAGIPGKDLFQAIYKCLLNRDRGPRAGWFLSLLDHAFVTGRFREAADT